MKVDQVMKRISMQWFPAKAGELMRWPNRFFPIPRVSGLEWRASFLGWREPGIKSQRKWWPTQTSSLIPNVRWTSSDFNFSHQLKAQLCVVFIFNVYVVLYNSFSTGHLKRVKEPHTVMSCTARKHYTINGDSICNYGIIQVNIWQFW